MNLLNIFFTIALALIVFRFETSYAAADADMSVEQKAEIEEKLKALTPEARLEAISRAEVVEKEIDQLHRETPEKIAEIDVVENLNQICGANYGYINDLARRNVAWPTVSCKYHRSEKILGGSTNKFLCDFNETKKNGEKTVKTRKVKYPAFLGMPHSELVPSLLSSSIARMIGFYTESYCPALIVCENCPHNMPYEFGKSRGRASHRTFGFRNSMVEMKAKVMTITPNTPRVHPRKPHGLAWTELFNIQETAQKSKRELAIEREAWLLWLNFIVEMDAYSSNQRLACDEAHLKDSEVYCDKPVMYTHDYGQSFFGRFQFEKWKEHLPLIQNPDGTCRGGMTSKVIRTEKGGHHRADVHIGPLVSAEARDFLVGRLRHISDKQWRDISRIANTQRLFSVSPTDFLITVKAKIELMARVSCAPFDSRSSVLSAQVR